MRLSHAISLRIVTAISALVLLVPGSWAKTHRSTHHTSTQTTAGKTQHASKTKSVSRTSKVSGKTSKHGTRVKKPRGQQVIDSERTRAIQAALIREHYMSGEPTGEWDASTKAACTKFQSDNGWQTKVIPDSRALIKLGLGPSREGLLNPETAAMGAPHELGVEKEIPGASAPHK